MKLNWNVITVCCGLWHLDIGMEEGKNTLDYRALLGRMSVL